MKNSKILQAYNATESLIDNTNLSATKQWELYQLRKKLLSHVEFMRERIKAIQNKYTQFADENGMLSGDKAIEFQNEASELDNMEKDVSDIEKVEFYIDDNDGITVRTMEALEDFIEFKK